MEKETRKLVLKTLAIWCTVGLFCPITCCFSVPLLYRSQVPVFIDIQTHPDIVEANLNGKKVPQSEIRSFTFESRVQPIRVEFTLKDGQKRELVILFSPDVDSSDGLYTDGKKVVKGTRLNVRVSPPLILSSRYP